MSKSKKNLKRYVPKMPTKDQIVRVLKAEDFVCDVTKIIKTLGLSERSQRKSLRNKLAALEKRGLIQIEGGKVSPVENSAELVVGLVSSHPRGFAFLIPDEEGVDTFLPPREAKTVLDGDKVLVRLVSDKSRGRVHGRVVKVLEPGRSVVVGRYVEGLNQPMIEPIGSSLKTPMALQLTQNLTPRVGELVSAEIVRTSNGTIKAIAILKEILGGFADPEMPFELAVRNNAIPISWNEEVLNMAENIAKRDWPKPASKRIDMREYPFVTIDGIDAKDFDDAVYVERSSIGFSLYVAIADVSAYVERGDAIDRAAFERATSVYFSQRVVPMLPEVLSNNLCSLIPKEDRLAIVACLEVDAGGHLKGYKFCEAVINSKARLTYDEVQAANDGNLENLSLKMEVIENLSILKEVYHALRIAREKRFALDIDSSEARYKFGKEGRIEEITMVPRTDSQRIIEECMIIANVAAAKFCLPESIPYRTHPIPDSDKIENLKWEAKKFGITTTADLNDPLHLCNSLLKKTYGRSDRSVIETMVMRSQKLASYSSSKKSHFGLALSEYTHFTSPIRRYSDLLVHWSIKKKIRKSRTEENSFDVESIALHCSKCERRAEEATREELAYLKCEFMDGKIGMTYEGIVTGIIEFGTFVLIPSNSVEGFVPAENRSFNKGKKNKCGGGVRLGQSVGVVVKKVDMSERKVYFDTVSTTEDLS